MTEPAPAPPQQPAQHGRGAVWAVFLASVLLPLALQAGGSSGLFLTSPKRLLGDASPLLQWLPLVGVGLLAAAWTFVLGGLIGSFLNVVVYRLPRGQSIVLGGSHCPRCGQPIHWHDNLPIVGWLMLNGRCRSCRLPIAVRYPLVESVSAGLFLAVFFLEIVSGGKNIPVRQPDWQHTASLMLDPRLDLVGLACYHAFALSVLLVWGLIALDRQRLPARSVVAVLASAVGLSILFPSLHPMPVSARLAEFQAAGDWLARGLAVSVVGGLAGVLVGLLWEQLLRPLLRGDSAGRTGSPLQPPCFLGIGLALVGIVLGWQGMLGTTVLLGLVCLCHVMLWSSLARWPTVPPEILLVPAAFVHLSAWRLLVTQLGPWWPGTAPTAACLAIPVAVVAILAVALVAITPKRRCPQPPVAADSSRAEPSGNEHNASPC